MERWVFTRCRELMGRVLIWNTRHLVRILREFEIHYNMHRRHQGLGQAGRRDVPAPIADPDRVNQLTILREDRLGGILHEYRHAT